MRLPQQTRRRRFLCAVGAAGVTLLSGCAGSSEDTDTPASTGEPAGTPTTTPTVSAEPTETARPGLSVPDQGLADEPVRVIVSGVEPDEDVTIRALMRTEGAGQFESFAKFEASEDGTVDVPERAPVDGTYESADGMGLFWSMYPRSELADPADVTLDSTTVDERGRTVHVRATAGDEVVATTRTRRRTVADGVTTGEPGDGLVGRLFLPPDDESGPYPGTILLHGGTPNISVEPAGLLASRGVAALALKWLGPEDGLPPRPVHVPLEYFERAVEWLTDHPDVRSGGVGVAGISLGGVAAQLVATRFDGVDAAVATASSTMPFKGDPTTDGKSPFAHGGEPVPAVYATYDDAERRDGKLYSRPVFETALERASERELEEAWIPHEEADADFLFVTGRDDAVWPATELADRAVDRLDEVGYERDYRHLAYEGAGHMITVPYGVTTQMTEGPNRIFGGTPAGLARAEADSWPEIRDLLGSVG